MTFNPIEHSGDVAHFIHKILPEYRREGKSIVQPVDFISFFNVLDKEIRALKRIPLKSNESQLAWYERKRNFYDDKIAYTVQYSSGRPKKICFMLHGMGDDPMEMARRAPKVDDILFIVPRAFRPFKILWNVSWNYQWFDIGSLSHPNKELIMKGLSENRPVLIEWIEDILEVHDMTYDDLILCGFSQGAITALDLLNYDKRLRYAIAVAGGINTETVLPDQSNKYILLIHHPLDPIVPYEAAQETLVCFKNAGACITLQEPLTKGHLIFFCAKTQEYMREFLQAVMGQKS